MAAGLAIVGGLKLFGAAKGYSDAKKGAKAQRAIDEENIQRQIRENQETIRRTKSGMLSTEATASTAAASSGFGRGSTKDTYVDKLKKIHARDLDWLEESQASGIDISRVY